MTCGTTTMTSSSFYTPEELATLGLGHYGEGVLISRFARLYTPSAIRLGNRVRIDDFCILSAAKDTALVIDDHVHISAGVYLYGQGGLHIQSYANLSASVKVYTQTDDFSGEWLMGPMVPNTMRHVIQHPVVLGRFCVLGAGTTLLPGAYLEEGAAVGAMSLVKSRCSAWTVYGGIPARVLGPRSKGARNLYDAFIEDPSVS
jgi:dTDP-4-amino-4,6-dideoxy-D-glucose acyltransferase